jgi:hypothetical protein
MAANINVNLNAASLARGEPDFNRDLTASYQPVTIKQFVNKQWTKPCNFEYFKF